MMHCSSFLMNNSQGFIYQWPWCIVCSYASSRFDRRTSFSGQHQQREPAGWGLMAQSDRGGEMGNVLQGAHFTPIFIQHKTVFLRKERSSEGHNNTENVDTLIRNYIHDAPQKTAKGWLTTLTKNCLPAALFLALMAGGLGLYVSVRHHWGSSWGGAGGHGSLWHGSLGTLGHRKRWPAAAGLLLLLQQTPLAPQITFCILRPPTLCSIPTACCKSIKSMVFIIQKPYRRPYQYRFNPPPPQYSGHLMKILCRQF